MSFRWDGSDIGNIIPYLTKIEVESYGVIASFRNGDRAFLNCYKNSILLIVDEIKPLFGLTKVGRHSGIYGKYIVLISRIRGDEQVFDPDEHLDKSARNDIKKCYIFRMCLGLTGNYDSSLLQRVYPSGVKMITSYKDVNISFNNEECRGSVISNNAIKRWFVDCEDVYVFAEKLFRKLSLLQLRFSIDKIIRRIDPKWVSLTYWIISRVQEYTNDN